MGVYRCWNDGGYYEKRLSRLMVLLKTLPMNSVHPSRIVAVWHSIQNSGDCLRNKRLPDTVFVRSSIGQAATRTVPAPRGGTAPGSSNRYICLWG